MYSVAGRGAFICSEVKRRRASASASRTFNNRPLTVAVAGTVSGLSRSWNDCCCVTFLGCTVTVLEGSVFVACNLLYASGVALFVPGGACKQDSPAAWRPAVGVRRGEMARLL